MWEEEVGHNSEEYKANFNTDYHLCMINAKEPVTSPYFKKEEAKGQSAKEELKEDNESSDSDSEGDPDKDPFDLPEARRFNQVTEQKPYLTTTFTKDLFLIITNRWRFIWCDGKGCPLETQHTHVIIDINARPKTNLRTFHINIYRCQEND